MTTSGSRRGVSIKIFLIDGVPEGPRLSEMSGWTGCCLDFARSDFVQARQRDEVGRTGLYVLVGDGSEDAGFRPKVYVGEGDVVRSRLDQHQKEKEFWTRCFIFASKDASLNKAHVRYLEARLVSLAHQAGAATLDNGSALEARGLSEAERDDMESYLDKVLLLLPLLGVQAFSPVSVPRRVAPGPVKSTGFPPGPVAGDEVPFFLKTSGRGPNPIGVNAEARDTARGFVVLEGATGPAENKVMNPGYDAIGRELIDNGTLAPATSRVDMLILTRDYAFGSPSAAATVIAGSERRGPTVWKDGSGNTLADRWGSNAG